jgi:hypothetical protein
MNNLRCCIALLVGLFWHASVLAQSAPTEAQKTEASLHFRRGVELFQEDAHRAALVEFERAYDIAPDYRLLYNIGQTKLRLQDYLGVVQSYEAYLSQGGTGVPAERRTQVEEALVALRDRVGRLGITCNRDGSEVFIDDVGVGKTPIKGSIPVNVGRHRVLVRAADGANETRVVNVAGGDVAELVIELRRMPVQPGPTELLLRAEPGMSVKRKGAIATWSVGAALLIGSAATGVLALDAQKNFDRLIDNQGSKPQSISERRDKVETLGLTTDILIGAGAAAVVVGTVLWILDARDKRADAEEADSKKKLKVSFGPSGAQLRGSF